MVVLLAFVDVFVVGDNIGRPMHLYILSGKVQVDEL